MNTLKDPAGDPLNNVYVRNRLAKSLNLPIITTSSAQSQNITLRKVR